MTDQTKTALLSKLRAPVADERITWIADYEPLYYFAQNNKVDYNALCTAVRAALASAPAPFDRRQLRALVDLVWNEATESTAVPDTPWADRMIDKVFSSLPASAAVAGEADEEDAADAWRRLALQFDGHRMQAIGWLKVALAELPDIPAWSVARAFLSAPPLSGEQVLAERIRAIAAPQASAVGGKEVRDAALEEAASFLQRNRTTWVSARAAYEIRALKSRSAALSAQPGAQKYWLCCGSKDPDHSDPRAPDCFNAAKAKWGTADQHSAAQKNGRA